MGTSNVALLERWFDKVWNHKSEETIDELLHDDAHILGLAEEPVHGRQGFKKFWHSFHGALSDIEVTVDETVAEGSKVAARVTVKGLHSGDGLGFEATGYEVSFGGCVFTTWEDGQIVSAYNLIDMAGLYKQLDRY